MTDILDKFIENAKQSVQEGYYDVPENKCKKVSLKKRLGNSFTLITEIKHASPAGEYSFNNIDVNKTSQSFLANRADAISVVVEPKAFRGNLMNVPIAKKTGLPVLLKDFIFCEEQIQAAKNVGADAVLLVVKVTARMNVDLDELIGTAHSNGLEVLLETYDNEEMKTALGTNAEMVGINNRDLRTLKVNLNKTKEICETVELDRPLISESGVKTTEDVCFVRAAGANGVLVGTAIWKAADPGAKIRELKSAGSGY